MKKYNYTNKKDNVFDSSCSKKCDTPNIIGDIDISKIPVDFSPAITFGDQNVYLPSGDIAIVKSNVEPSFSSIDKNFISNAINNQNPDNNLKNSELIFNCVDNEIEMIEGRYIVTLENLRNVFICRVNDIFYNPNTGTYALKIEDDPYKSYSDIRCDNVARGAFNTIKNFDSKYVSTIWKDSTLPTIILSNLNFNCIRFYYYVKEQILKYFSFMDVSTDVVECTFARVDKYFTSMMADMTYETSILFYNIEQIIPFVSRVKKSVTPVNDREYTKHRDMLFGNRYSPNEDEYM